MDNMTIEEKAKAYDEALKVLHKYDGANIMFSQSLKEEMFPELAESEDEIMLKVAIQFTKENQYKYTSYKGHRYSKEAILAWLEKQGEQPVDKVEPKFKTGDYVVIDGEVLHVKEVTENGYSTEEGGYIPFRCEKDARLWNIQDAKDGDVLVSESNCGLGTWYCIFKSLDDDESMTVYCYLARDGRFETKKELCFDKDPFNTKPATKEQRDTLMKAMADEGYIWDSKSKRLLSLKAGLSYTQNPVWSEDDEQYLEDTLNLLEGHRSKNTYGDVVEWLKELKDKCLPQPKHEWSEEDENMLQSILDEYKSMPIEKRNWLKSLRPQSQWKPSDGQMEALRYVTNFDYGGHKATLVLLYEQLKKLKG